MGGESPPKHCPLVYRLITQVFGTCKPRSTRGWAAKRRDVAAHIVLVFSLIKGLATPYLAVGVVATTQGCGINNEKQTNNVVGHAFLCRGRGL